MRFSYVLIISSACNKSRYFTASSKQIKTINIYIVRKSRRHHCCSKLLHRYHKEMLPGSATYVTDYLYVLLENTNFFLLPIEGWLSVYGHMTRIARTFCVQILQFHLRLLLCTITTTTWCPISHTVLYMLVLWCLYNRFKKILEKQNSLEMEST